ncbi:MAG: helix-turn-helix domain-containing protein [Lachnospiraceae bacterium]|nr:helix-turn-helix domain-containing protein [Lachnospiraceae bacterium]
MGYGQNLKEILDSKDMTVKQLALKTKIAPTTLYSIIQRDAAIRFDTALKIANVLDVPVNSLCKDNPYDDMETLPELPKIKKNSANDAYMSDRTKYVLRLFDYEDLPKVDELIVDLYILDDNARKDLFDYIKMMKKNHTSPEREAEVKKIKYKF